jgi:hypothetical protein
MKKVDVDKHFITEILPEIIKQEKEHGGKIDKPLRSCTYNEYVDYLSRDGSVTPKQRDSWCIPARLIK